MKIVHCRPTAPVSVGGANLNGLMARSDMLSAALTSLWSQVHDQDSVATVAKEPPFRISSAMPCIFRKEGVTVLFPVPIGMTALLARRHPELAKEVRRLRWADAVIIKRIITDQLLPPLADLDCWDDYSLLSIAGGKKGKRRWFARDASRPRLQVDRLTNGPAEGMLFESHQRIYSRECGFSLVIDTAAENETGVLSVLRLLGLQGVGANRSVGHGTFAVEQVEPFDRDCMSIPGTEGARMLLSLLWPTEGDIGSGALNGAYDVVTRGGWVTSAATPTLRRPSLRMLVEGSWFPADATVEGGCVRVGAPSAESPFRHPVFRDGRCLSIPIPSPPGEERT